MNPILEHRLLLTKISNDFIARQKRTAEQQEALRKLNTNNEEWSPDIVLPEAQRTQQTDIGSVNVRSDIEIEVTDCMALVKAVANADFPLDYLTVNIAYIKKDVKQFNWSVIPGIKIIPSTVITGRGK